VARKLTRLSNPSLFRAWAFRIATHAALGHLLTDKRRALDDSDIAPLENLAALNRHLA
jgi:DNA-directed RNA polymerase specialized sigma24 family protein